MDSQGPFLNLEYIFSGIYDFLFGASEIVGQESTFREVLNFLYGFSYAASAILLVLVIYYLMKIRQHKAADEIRFQSMFDHHHLDIHETGRWDMVVQHASSDNPAEWRVAILEADAMLDEYLREFGYSGAGVGEMLQQLGEGDMRTLQDAWDAHKVRNKIAHEGINYGLSETETHQVIALYRRVFEELGKI